MLLAQVQSHMLTSLMHCWWMCVWTVAKTTGYSDPVGKQVASVCAPWVHDLCTPLGSPSVVIVAVLYCF